MYIKPSNNVTQEENYQLFIEYVNGYLDKKLPNVSNLANFSAIVFDFFKDVNWAGFYLMMNDSLILGPFQGKAACVEIQIGKGVCGTAAKKQKTIIVGDTSLFEGHITCDPVSKSEIVIPIMKNNQLFGVFDIDSPIVNRFTDEDRVILEKAVHLLVDIL